MGQSFILRRERIGVSMESGLDGRNNCSGIVDRPETKIGLNGVRPRWPEQSAGIESALGAEVIVSMESGLDGRNNLP